MIDPEVEDLLAAWAVDAVDDFERARVERAIAADPALAERARALREAAARLAELAAQAPPVGLRDRVLADIAATAQVGTTPAAAQGSAREPVTGSPSGGRHRPRGRTPGDAAPPRRRPMQWAVAAAIAALAALTPTVLAIQQAQRASIAEREVALLTEYLGRPGATLISAEVAGGGRVSAVVGGEGAVFTASDLPALERARDYQLWVIDDGAPESAGLLTVAGGAALVVVPAAGPGSALAMTVEPAGGSEQPTSEPVVVLAAGS